MLNADREEVRGLPEDLTKTTDRAEKSRRDLFDKEQFENLCARMQARKDELLAVKSASE